MARMQEEHTTQTRNKTEGGILIGRLAEELKQVLERPNSPKWESSLFGECVEPIAYRMIVQYQLYAANTAG